MNDQMSNDGMGGNMMCNCKHHKVAPWSHIVIGALFILSSLGVFGIATWPMLVAGALFIVMGVMKVKNGCKCCSRP